MMVSEAGSIAMVPVGPKTAPLFERKCPLHSTSRADYYRAWQACKGAASPFMRAEGKKRCRMHGKISLTAVRIF
jgi:hypothetical protein